MLSSVAAPPGYEWGVLVMGVLVSWACAHLFARSSFLTRMDADRRDVDPRTVPRAGGIAVLTALASCTGVAAFLGHGLLPIRFLVAGIMVAFVSLVDDFGGLPAGLRLLAHVLAAVVVVEGGMYVGRDLWPGGAGTLPSWFAVPTSILFVIWMVNMYNFMDGIDGLAVGAAVVGFAAFSWLGFAAGHPRFANASAVVSAACLGLLPLNWAPARVFLGDLGSTLIGYLVAAFSLWAARDGILPLWVAILVFAPLLWDSSSTLLRRLIAGQDVLTSHQDHLYQRAVRTGYSHARVSSFVLVLMSGTSVTAVFAIKQAAWVQWGSLAAWLLIFVAIELFVARTVGRSVV